MKIITPIRKITLRTFAAREWYELKHSSANKYARHWLINLLSNKKG